MGSRARQPSGATALAGSSPPAPTRRRLQRTGRPLGVEGLAGSAEQARDDEDGLRRVAGGRGAGALEVVTGRGGCAGRRGWGCPPPSGE